MKVLAGLIGEQIQASGSPRIHEEEAKANGIDLVYKLADLDSPSRTPEFFPSMLDAVETLGFAGVNVTHPFKEVAFKHVDKLSEDAKLIGSINTVVFRDGKRFGANTDWIGFTENLKASIPDLEIEKVALIGTGGAGLAVAYAMLRMGTKTLNLFDADSSRAEKLAEKLKRNFPDRTVVISKNAADALRDVKGMIQATPIGMTGKPGVPIDLSLLRSEMWVSDLIYFPLETELIRAAKAKGCRAVGGGGMAVRQAAASFKQFFNVEPDVKRMLAKFEEIHIGARK